MPLKLKPPRPGKTPYWSVRGSHLGVKVDRSTQLTDRAKAAKLLAVWREEIERGALAGHVEKPMSFGEAALSYIQTGGERRFVGAYDPARDHWTGLVGRLRSLTLPEITQAIVDEAATALYPNATPATKNRQVHTVVSAILKHAGKVDELRRPKGWRGNKRVTWLRPEQAFALFEVADKADAEFGILLRFLCYTGLRLSEALMLPCKQVMLGESFAYVADTKNEDPRGVHLPPIVVAALAGHPRGMEREGTVFRFRKSGHLYDLFRGALKAAGVVVPARSGFHIFRHTWATWMRRYGGLDTRGLVGTGAWRDEQSASRYQHVVVSEEARRADLLPIENTRATRGVRVDSATRKPGKPRSARNA